MTYSVAEVVARAGTGASNPTRIVSGFQKTGNSSLFTDDKYLTSSATEWPEGSSHEPPMAVANTCGMTNQETGSRAFIDAGGFLAGVLSFFYAYKFYVSITV